jgi:two-component system phosphate regulon sensor histidine kinase PhoR
MDLEDAPLLSQLTIVLAAFGLSLIGGLLYVALSTRARLRQREEELAATKEELLEQSVALEDLKQQVERLQAIPKVDGLTMLQLAHEQRSPLAAIQNALDMLLDGYAAHDPGLQNEMLGLARDRASTTLARINNLLRLGSVQHAQLGEKTQRVQLLDVLRALTPEKRIQARWKAVELHIAVPDSLPAVTGTYEGMEHLLSNLVDNAIKYTRPGGKVTITLKEQDGEVVGSVKDTGVGISPEDLPRIFDEFYRAENAKSMAQGTGLGLSIVKQVVDRNGGRLDVESKLGVGSEFTFTFPVARSPKKVSEPRV